MVRPSPGYACWRRYSMDTGWIGVGVAVGVDVLVGVIVGVCVAVGGNGVTVAVGVWVAVAAGNDVLVACASATG